MGKEHDLDSVIAEIRAALERLVEAKPAVGQRLRQAVEQASRGAASDAPPSASPSPEALARVPALLAAYTRCLPVSLDDGTLIVLAGEPADVGALRLLEDRLGPIRVHTAPFDVVWSGIEKAYGDGAIPPTAQEALPVETGAPERVEEEKDSTVSEAAPVADAETLPEIEAQEVAPIEPAPQVKGEVVREATEEEFASLMADVQRQAAEQAAAPAGEDVPPGDISEPRNQNLDLLEAFEAVSSPVNLTDPIEPMAMPTVGATQQQSDPKVVQAEISRLDALLGEGPAKADPDSEVPNDLVPADLAFRALCAPSAIVEGELVCLIADPPDIAGAEAIAQAAGMALRLQVCSRDDAIAALEARYGAMPEPALSSQEIRKDAKSSLLGSITKKFKKAA
ncbi:MAG TPA: hypothetical protein PLL78_05160 [Fimbriimonadaceae bacterium]|nr:hypothetical protein [Fimbriimonadaceae bacterium]HRJ96054.1 hypothetical protein [Fimbriimonadaceae bacterium]